MQFISSKAIVDILFRDFQINHSNWVGDAPDMIADAIDSIGYSSSSFKDMHKTITIENHSAFYTGDVSSIKSISYKGKRLPYASDLRRDAPKIIGESPVISTADSNTQTELNRLRKQYEDLEELKEPDNLEEITEKQEKIIDEMKVLIKTLNIPFQKSDVFNWYTLNGDRIITSFQKGDVIVFYKGFNMGDDDWPVIPNTDYFKNALSFYVLSRILMGGLRHPVFNFQTARNEWENYRWKCIIEAKKMNLDQMENFKNMWTAWKFNSSYHDNFNQNPYEAQ